MTNKLPPLRTRLWRCIRNYKKWRTVRKIDSAAVVLWSIEWTPENTQAWAYLMDKSNQLWGEILQIEVK